MEQTVNLKLGKPLPSENMMLLYLMEMLIFWTPVLVI